MAGGGLRRTVFGVLALASVWAHAVPIALNAGGTPFGAELLVGSSSTGVVFFHGRGQSPDGDVVRHLRHSLHVLGYTTLALENPVPAGGTAFANYAAQESTIDDQVFARLDAGLSELSSRGVQQVVLSGFSLGSRFMTAATAAWDSGIYSPTANVDLLALVGVGMYGSLGGSAPTTAPPLVIGDFNVLDTHSNLAFIHSVPVLDLFGDQDLAATLSAGLRQAQYGGPAGLYTQGSLACPPNNGSYYARVNGLFEPYYGADQTDYNRCHQLRNGWLPDGQGGFVESFIVRGAAAAPLEATVAAFLASTLPSNQIPEPPALALTLGALLTLLGFRRRARG